MKLKTRITINFGTILIISGIIFNIAFRDILGNVDRFLFSISENSSFGNIINDIKKIVIILKIIIVKIFFMLSP